MARHKEIWGKDRSEIERELGELVGAVLQALGLGVAQHDHCMVAADACLGGRALKGGSCLVWLRGLLRQILSWTLTVCSYCTVQEDT